jgi:hypothetical protein
MLPIQDLQRRFSALIGSPDRLRGLRGELALFARPGGLSDKALEERLGIYHYAVHARFVEAIEEDFPRTVAALARLRRRTGRSLEDWVAAYQRAHPSRHRSLARYGVDFAAFLARSRALSGAAWLGALARFEWEQVLSSFGEPLPPLDFASLARLSPEEWMRARFRFDPSARLFASGWRLDPWLADRPPVRLSCARGEFHALVFRGDSGRIAFHRLDGHTHGALHRLLRGARLPRAVAGIPPEAASQVTGAFATWARDGALRAISLT